MSKLRELTDDLRMIVPVAVLGRPASMMTDPAYSRLLRILRDLQDDPELDSLSAEELRALQTFRITVYRAGPMEPTTARKHIGATWRGTAKQALLKLSVGREAQDAVRTVMSGGIG